MANFYYENEDLFCENVKIEDIANKVGTPFYLYSMKELTDNFRAFEQAFSEVNHLICYACKTNDNLSILKVLAKEGAGADIVSGGELFKVIKLIIKYIIRKTKFRDTVSENSA